jgi:hypothetical protein
MGAGAKPVPGTKVAFLSHLSYQTMMVVASACPPKLRHVLCAGTLLRERAPRVEPDCSKVMLEWGVKAWTAAARDA